MVQPEQSSFAKPPTKRSAVAAKSSFRWSASTRTAAGFLCVLSLALVGALGPQPSVARAGVGADSVFSAKELKDLTNGKLVQRSTTEKRGGRHMMGGTSWQVIDAPTEVLWQALLDTKYFHRMLPQVERARIVRSAGDVRRLFVRHSGTLTETSYFLDVKVAQDRTRMTFRVDESSAKGIRAAWGYYDLRPYAGGKTLLIFGVMVDIGDGLIAMLVRSTVHEWLLKVPWMVKRFVEGSGRHIYKIRKT